MKKIFLILALIVTTIALSQAPEKMSYQAIVRNADGGLLSNTSVGMQISILENSASGNPIYVETHTPTTNINGLVTIEIGNGTVITGDFSVIDWGADIYFIKTETDLTGAANYTVSGTSQLLSVPYALHAKTASNVPNYKIGDFAHGGVIFWVDETNQHGLVCTITNQSSSIKWFEGSFRITQARGNGVYAGKANNSIIIAAQVALESDETVYAARLCNELEITENNIMYGDWYLPSKFELNLMYQNNTIINTTASANGGENFVNNTYWSSTEISESNVWILNLSTGVESSVFKSSQNYVRAIRSF
jgi:hypothetical protein